MPPRMVKRGAASAGPKRTARNTRGTAKAQNQPPDAAAEESVKVEEVSIPVVEEVSIPIVEEVKVLEKPVAVKLEQEAKADANGLCTVKKEDEVKESVDEYEKDERVELEDNDPEEYGGVDYDEKEIEHEDVQEVGDVGEEEHEEDADEEEEEEDEEEEEEEEEEGDMVEEEMEDVHEELEGEEEDEHTGEDQEHATLVDADEEEHHEVVKERRKRKEFEVFVGGLDKVATEDDLRKVFGAVGEVTEVRLMMNLQTKKNKGFAFLRFATVEQAKRAVTELKHPMINGKQCGVTPSQDSDTLFLGNICKTWTKEALKEKLKHYGVENVEDLTLVEDSNNEGMNRGFAFLEFSSRSEAMDAFKRLQKRDVVFGVDRPAKVSFADSFIDPGDEIMAQVKTVFVDGLPAAWDEDRVRELLRKYGEIEKIELARNMPSAKRRDFGFVTFDTHDAAVTCAKSINNAELGEGDSKAKVRARLSRPLQRGKGKHVGRGDLRSSHGAGRVVRSSWGRPTPRNLPVRGVRGIGSRVPPASMKRPGGLRDRRPVVSIPTRGRPLAPPARPYFRRAPVNSYPKSSLKREYGRRDELPPRSRAAAIYGPRAIPERRQSYRDDYSSRGPGYSDVPRSTARPAPRRAYVDGGYGHRFERPPPPPPSYREGRARDYDSMSGSKRPYAALDDVPPRYADSGVRQSRARLDYEYGTGASQYGDAYGDRLGRSNLGYGSGRSSASNQDSHGLYSSSRQGMTYGGGSFSGSDVGGMYSANYGGDYVSRGSDVGGSSYSSMYSGRGMGGSSYMGTGSSGSYY
ncbi:heterogeneous nuclear ribonucleoprotein R-like [Juglans microcarpa x Juglans regia]|uniref:heterogeneous nuclear ribonucleoprotein R-like n=1 Tax=Juglans microcarpa x Juglans regia TaxID=2249226 RepID=UPI001B7E4135|nr:heterogeneous nuclear ribonucleoprotein R-like [Juglans microcarpa x Juglans regia]